MEILIQCYLKRILELRYINKTESHTHITVFFPKSKTMESQ